MKISFVQSGGFLGVIRECKIDTTVLARDTAQKIEHIAKTSGISVSGEFFSDSGRDLQQYEITIADKNSTISVVFDDDTVPVSAKSLVGYLKSHSRIPHTNAEPSSGFGEK